MFLKTGVFMLVACCFALPALAQYDVPSFKADAAKMADLTFSRQPVELGLFSTIHNGLFKPEGMKDGERYPALVLLHTCGGVKPRQMRYWIESGTRATGRRYARQPDQLLPANADFGWSAHQGCFRCVGPSGGLALCRCGTHFCGRLFPGRIYGIAS